MGAIEVHLLMVLILDSDINISENSQSYGQQIHIFRGNNPTIFIFASLLKFGHHCFMCVCVWWGGGGGGGVSFP